MISESRFEYRLDAQAHAVSGVLLPQSINSTHQLRDTRKPSARLLAFSSANSFRIGIPRFNMSKRAAEPGVYGRITNEFYCIQFP
jgi:hypothetical protein